MRVEAKPEVVIWGDGSGSTFRAVADAVGTGLVALSISGVITTNPEAGILDYVRDVNELYGLDIVTTIVPGAAGRRQTHESEKAVMGFLEDVGTRNLALLGCMNIIGKDLVQELNGDVPSEELPKALEEARGLLIPSDNGYYYKVPLHLLRPDNDTVRYSLVNFHPALTDITANTYGLNASRRILQLPVNKTAWTMHAVSEGVDTGPKIAVYPVDVPDYGKALQGAALEQAAQRLFDDVQTTEKLHGPIELAKHYAAHDRWIGRAAYN